MTIKSGLMALSALCLVSLVMLVIPDDEAYRWVDQSSNSAIVLVICAVLGFAAALSGRFEVGFVAGAIALIAALVQLVGLTDGGLLGGNGSTMALLLGVGLGFCGLALAERLGATEAASATAQPVDA